MVDRGLLEKANPLLFWHPCVSSGKCALEPTTLWLSVYHSNHSVKSLLSCVPSNFMANRQEPEFSLNNCAQSSKKTFICPKFRTNPVFKYTKCHISKNLSNFLKLCLLYCQKLFALDPTNRRFTEKNWLSGNTAAQREHCCSVTWWQFR